MKRDEYPPSVQRAIAEAEDKQRRYGGRVEIVQPTVPLMTIRPTAKGRMPTPAYRSQLEADYASIEAEFLQAQPNGGRAADDLAWWQRAPKW